MSEPKAMTARDDLLNFIANWLQVNTDVSRPNAASKGLVEALTNSAPETVRLDLAEKLNPWRPKEHQFMGFRLIADPALPPNIFEIHGSHGVQRFTIPEPPKALQQNHD